MAVTLKKGEGISLRKDGEFDLSMVTMGLGWDVTEPKKGLIGSIFGKKEEDYDLDAIAFLLGKDGKVHNLGQQGDNGTPTLVDGDVVFYNSLRHSSGAIWLTGDNRTGAGDGDEPGRDSARSGGPARPGLRARREGPRGRVDAGL